MFRSLKVYKVISLDYVMKILREKSRVYNGKPYYKYKINIPEEILKEAKFKVGDELRVEVMEGIVKLKKVK